MIIGIIADTHGQQKNIPVAIKKAGVVDCWLHAGDCHLGQDITCMQKFTNRPICAVAGNNDSYGGSQLADNEILELAGKKIWLTHGHQQNVKWDLRNLLAAAKHHQVDITVFGHTHEAYVDLVDNIWLLNPGSLSLAFYGQPSFAIVKIDAEGIVAAEIIKI